MKPTKNPSLHGSAPDSCATALLVIDMINDLDFSGGERLLETALPAAERIAALKSRGRGAGVPAIYVNDNFGRWRSDFRETVSHCGAEASRGRPLVELLHPEKDDYFVLKPKHSGFLSSTLETLLEYLGAERLILTGVATDICVLFTANDAYMRDFEVLVPNDCTAAETPERRDQALEIMRRVLKADLTPSDEIDLRQGGRREAAF